MPHDLHPPRLTRAVTRVRWLGLALAAVAAILALPHTANAYSLGAISVDTADRVETRSVSVSVTGSSETSQYTYMYVHRGTGACAATAYSESVVSLATVDSGYYPVSGSFTRTGSFTPDTPGTYRLCSYLSSNSTAAPLATSTTLTDARAATASFTGSISIATADRVETQSVSVSVSGTTEISKYTYMYAHRGTGGCAATAYTEAASSFATIDSGYYPVNGSFTRTGSFTPDSPGTYRLCAYVASGTTGSPVATATSLVVVRAMVASVSTISLATADAKAGSSVSIAVTGTTEFSSTLTVFAHEGTGPCAATSALEDAVATSYEVTYFGSVGPSAFSDSGTFYPTYGGEYRVCAYLGSATGTATITVGGTRRPTPVATTGCAANGTSLTVSINGGAQYTRSPAVTLTLGASSLCTGALRIANDGGFATASSVAFTRSAPWTLAASGPERLPKTVYVQFPGIVGTFTDDIILDQTPPVLARASARIRPTAPSASGARPVIITSQATDATSGVAGLQVKAGSSTRSFAYATQTGIRIAGRNLRVRAKDGAGNFSPWRSVRVRG